MSSASKSKKRVRDEASKQLCLEVLKEIFNDALWEKDKTTSKGGYRGEVAELFSSDLLETLYEEGDPHLKCDAKEIADVLQEYLQWGIETFPEK